MGSVRKPYKKNVVFILANILVRFCVFWLRASRNRVDVFFSSTTSDETHHYVVVVAGVLVAGGVALGGPRPYTSRSAAKKPGARVPGKYIPCLLTLRKLLIFLSI